MPKDPISWIFLVLMAIVGWQYLDRYRLDRKKSQLTLSIIFLVSSITLLLFGN